MPPADGRYMSGFANEFATEALPGALPEGHNSPQRAPYGLYAEQLSGTAFTAPRHANRRSWLYRIRPAAVHEPFEPMDNGQLISRFDEVPTPPNQMRWDPIPMPSAPTDFVGGLVTMAGTAGCGIHVYAANRSMDTRYFYNADGELLIVPQQGRLVLATELGTLEVEPQEICVVPRGVRFQVRLPDGPGARLCLRELQRTVQAARPWRLLAPTAWPIRATSVRRWPPTRSAKETSNGGRSSTATYGAPPIGHSPLDVVAWHGNYAPYKYDLRRFNTIGSISYDHPGSVDLPRAAVAQRHPGRGHNRLRHLPAALAGRWRTPFVRPGTTATSPASSWA